MYFVIDAIFVSCKRQFISTGYELHKKRTRAQFFPHFTKLIINIFNDTQVPFDLRYFNCKNNVNLQY